MPGKEQTSVVKEERKKIDLKIAVKDFGPISSGEITLKPLTVFIGPNNSGKSYAAMLIHSIFESYTAAIQPGWATTHMKPSSDVSVRETPELEKLLDDLEEGQEIDISPYIEIPTKGLIEQIYQETLADEIARSFACRIGELVRIGKGSLSLELGYDSQTVQLVCQEGELRVRDYSELVPDMGIRITVTTGDKYSFVMPIDLLLPIDQILGDPDSRVLISWSKDDGMELPIKVLPGSPFTFSQLANKVLKKVAMKCHYLPAAKSGMLQVHKVLVAGIVRNIPYVGTEKLEIPKFSGVVSDFLSSIIELPEEKGPFYQLARDFEEKLIRGEIVTPTSGEHLYPEIKYKFRDTEIPLHRSSSTVSELAPLFLYLKYMIRPNSILIIEEPEAHLHPGNQRILARLLVRLVREGVNLIITTHSEYLLEQLRNFILLSKVEPEKRVEKYQYGEEDYLTPDEFAAYVFHHDKESKGYKIDKVQMSEDGEISQDEFVNIIDALYEETIKLRIDLNDET